MDWLANHDWQAWLGLTILLGLAEMVSLDFMLLMLAGGAAVGMIAAMVGAPVALQVVLASVAALAALLRGPSERRQAHAPGPDLALGHGKLVGQQGLVTERITAMDPGRIKLAGEIWSAQPYDETLVIEPGETVDILQIKGATALVHPVPRLEP